MSLKIFYYKIFFESFSFALERSIFHCFIVISRSEEWQNLLPFQLILFYQRQSFADVFQIRRSHKLRSFTRKASALESLFNNVCLKNNNQTHLISLPKKLIDWRFTDTHFYRTLPGDCCCFFSENCCNQFLFNFFHFFQNKS